MADPVFPITLDDTSPTIVYAPFGDSFGVPDLSSGWNPYYTDSGFATDPGPLSSGPGVSDIGNGTSLHLTASDGAQLAIKWNGTAIDIHGTVTGLPSASMSYSISLDGTATTNYFSSQSPSASVGNATTDVLAGFSNLTYGEHEVVLTVHNLGVSGSSSAANLDAVVAFDRAILYMETSGSPPTPSSSTSVSPSPTPTVTTSIVPDNSVSYRGQWSFVPGLLPNLPSEAFHTSTTTGDSAHIEFNGSAVTLSGLTTPSSGTYTIILDNYTYPLLSARSSFTSSPTILFYAAGLDPAAMHGLDIVNSGPEAGSSDRDSFLVVLAGGVNVTTTQNTNGTVPSPIGALSTSTGLAHGAIAAIAIGSTLGLIILICIVLVLILWRRRVVRRKESLLVNPRLSYWGANWRKWFPTANPGISDPREDISGMEKHWEEQHAGEVDTREVLEIGEHARYYEKDDDNEEEAERRRRAKGKMPLRPRHASQNSDGSFSIELPELSSTPLQYPPASFPSTPQPLSLRSQLSTLPHLTASQTSSRSPRPRGPREMHGRDSSRGILLSQIITPTSDLEEEASPQPLRVEFAHEQERPERRTERYLSTGGFSLPQSLKQALSRGREAEVEGDAAHAGTSRPSTLRSFLDFSSSSSGSRSPSAGRSRSARVSASNSRSNSTRSTRNSTKSKRNTGSERSTTSVVPPERRMSLGLSMTIGGGPTASRPSLTPEISLQTVPLPPPVPMPQSIHSPGTSDADRLQADPTGMLPSPTDSIPLTVSDIHFRHSVHSSASQVSESRRTSAIRTSGSHRPPHPPLPGSQSTPASPVEGTHTRENSQVLRSAIVQKLMGIQGTGSTSNTPLASPTLPDPRGSRSVTEESQLTPTPMTTSFGQRSGTFGFGLGRLR